MYEKYGPNSAEVERFLALLPDVTPEQAQRAKDAHWDCIYRRPGWFEAVDALCLATDGSHYAYAAATAAQNVTRFIFVDEPAGRNAALALAVRHRVTPERFAALVAPFHGIEGFEWLFQPASDS